MFMDAVMLAILTSGGILMLYSKFPPRVKAFIEKHYLLTDLITFVATYYCLGGTLTAMLASAMCDILVSVLLFVANHPDRFVELYKFKKTMQIYFDKILDGLNGFAETINESV